MKVACPICGEVGYVYVKSVAWGNQVYCLHPVKRDGKWTKVWHRVGGLIDDFSVEFQVGFLEISKEEVYRESWKLATKDLMHTHLY